MTRSPRPSEADALLGAGCAAHLDPLDLVRHCLDRIAGQDGRIGAFADLDATRARAEAAASAQRWNRGAARSPLDGIPLAVKSNIAVEGLPWTAGIGAHRDRRASADAACVARLRAAGAVILGTTRMDEAAFGATGANPWFGRTVNPYRPDAIPGGSSSGSAAAVAAGFCAAALGTDTFGSVRIPAAWCGVFGAKPAAGSIDLAGVVPLARSFDCLGFLARHAEDCRRLGHCLGLPAPGGRDPDRPTIALAGFAGEAGGIDIVRQAVQEQLDRLDLASRELVLTPDPFEQLMKPALLVAEAEGAAIHLALLEDPAAALSPRLRRLLEWGRAKPAAELERVRSIIRTGRAALLDQLAGCDLLVTPATMSTAPPIGEDDDRQAARFTLAASLCGMPALAVPIGLSPDGLPLAAQIMGHDWHRVLDLGAALGRVPPSPILAPPRQATS
jgi:aspartyl-tRNA(Asn)/glutamyl-tRNA(Gln) amidotransferase subunit A